MSASIRPQSAVAPIPKLDLENDGENDLGKRSSRRSARPSTATARSSVSSEGPLSPAKDTLKRDARTYFESFSKNEMQELIAQYTASWLFSSDFRGNPTTPGGLMSHLTLTQEPFVTLTFKKEEDVPEIEYREVNQIIKELTIGIFALNQLPTLTLEPNFDLGSTVNLPLAYKNTLVGKILLSIDYRLKSLWHGVTVPEEGKRTQLSEGWRNQLHINAATGAPLSEKVNMHTVITAAGQQYVTGDNEINNAYANLRSIDPSQAVAASEKEFFNKYADHLRCSIICYVDELKSCKNLNVLQFNSTYDIDAQVLLTEDKIEQSDLQRLKRRLRYQVEMLKKTLELDPAFRRNIVYLKLITFLSPLLATLRKKLMKIPDKNELISLAKCNIKTDKELPPFSIDDKCPCNTFIGKVCGLTHAHGGIYFDIETPTVEASLTRPFCDNVEDIGLNFLEYVRSEIKKEKYTVPTISHDSNEYYIVHIPLTTYYPASPRLPEWLHAMYDVINHLRPRRLPMSDLQINELYKITFGFKAAMNNKSVDSGLKMSACRGLVAPFIALSKKINTSQLYACDMEGLALLHYAAIHSRPMILSLLLSHSSDVNVKRRDIKVKSDENLQVNEVMNDEKLGFTALHYAARSGSVECCTLLLCNHAQPFARDGNGWTPAHHAAACNHVPILRLFASRNIELLDTNAIPDQLTPLLVAASYGALQTTRYLLSKGVRHDSVDSNGNNTVHRAILNFHPNILEFYINRMGNSLHELNVWQIIVDMLSSGMTEQQDAVLRCLEMLLHSKPAYWVQLLEIGAIQPLVDLLQNYNRVKSGSNHIQIETPLCSLACSVICLMSEQNSIRREVAKAGAIPILISLLKPKHETHNTIIHELQSRSSVVLSDIAAIDNYAVTIAQEGGIKPLVQLLDEEVFDVLVNAVNTIKALCRGDKEGKNQDEVVECGVVPPLVYFLQLSESAHSILTAASAAAIAEICRCNRRNQDILMDFGAIKNLVMILRGHNFEAKLHAALAVESITRDNLNAQKCATDEKAHKALCGLFNAIDEKVREHGACALWALAGDHPEQRRMIAEEMTLRQIKDMLNSNSQMLRLVGLDESYKHWKLMERYYCGKTVGANAVLAIAYMSAKGQESLVSFPDMSNNLIRLLRLNTTSRPVVIATIDAIGAICIGVAHTNNKVTQLALAECGAIELLVNRVWESTQDELLQVKLLYALSCLVSGCKENEDRLNNNEHFGFEIVLELLNSPNAHVILRATSTLAMFAFNRVEQQRKILKIGGLSILTFEELIMSLDMEVKSHAAYQMVVLGRVIYDMPVVDSSARGVLLLVSLLDSDEDNVLIVTAQNIASLSHTRAGIPEAIVTGGAVNKLLNLIRHKNDYVQQSAAYALGYLSFNRVASREMMVACRSTNHLFKTLKNIVEPEGKLSDEFEAEFKRQSSIGFPLHKVKAIVKKPAKNEKNKKIKPVIKKKSTDESPPTTVLVTETPRKGRA